MADNNIERDTGRIRTRYMNNVKVMSLKNKKIVLKFMSEYLKGNNDSFSYFLTDDIKWNIVGMPSIKGKSNFLRAMEMMELWQSTLSGEDSPAEIIKNIVAESDFVVVERAGKQNNSCSCDIYKIKNGKIEELTTYIVDTSLNE